MINYCKAQKQEKCGKNKQTLNTYLYTKQFTQLYHTGHFGYMAPSRGTRRVPRRHKTISIHYISKINIAIADVYHISNNLLLDILVIQLTTCNLFYNLYTIMVLVSCNKNKYVHIVNQNFSLFFLNQQMYND